MDADAKINSNTAITPVIATVNRMVILVPTSARSSFPAPRFWETKVVAAMAMLCIGNIIN